MLLFVEHIVQQQKYFQIPYYSLVNILISLYIYISINFVRLPFCKYSQVLSYQKLIMWKLERKSQDCMANRLVVSNLGIDVISLCVVVGIRRECYATCSDPLFNARQTRNILFYIVTLEGKTKCNLFRNVILNSDRYRNWKFTFMIILVQNNQKRKSLLKYQTYYCVIFGKLPALHLKFYLRFASGSWCYIYITSYTARYTLHLTQSIM